MSKSKSTLKISKNRARANKKPDKPIPAPEVKAVADVGRPSIYSQEIADQICFRLAEGESLRQICRDENTPAMSTVFRWLLDERYKPFWEQYAKARDMQADSMFEELIEIADDGSNDWMERETERGLVIEVVNHEHIARSRLRVDTRKWFLSKVLPKKYGDKLEVIGDGLKTPQKIEIQVITVNGNGKIGKNGGNGKKNGHRHASAESQ